VVQPLATKRVRTPEEYWRTLLAAFPGSIPAENMVGFRHTFFSGMSAMVSLNAELWNSSLDEAEQKSRYREFVKYIHENDGIERD
jgi:hypothetical protein